MADTLDIAGLSTKERLDLIGQLWDSLAPEDGESSIFLLRRRTFFSIKSLMIRGGINRWTMR
jgi:hypothetical protein